MPLNQGTAKNSDTPATYTFRRGQGITAIPGGKEHSEDGKHAQNDVRHLHSMTAGLSNVQSNGDAKQTYVASQKEPGNAATKQADSERKHKDVRSNQQGTQRLNAQLWGRATAPGTTVPSYASAEQPLCPPVFDRSTRTFIYRENAPATKQANSSDPRTGSWVPEEGDFQHMPLNQGTAKNSYTPAKKEHSEDGKVAQNDVRQLNSMTAGLSNVQSDGDVKQPYLASHKEPGNASGAIFVSPKTCDVDPTHSDFNVKDAYQTASSAGNICQCFVCKDAMELAIPQVMGEHGFLFASAVCLDQIKCNLEMVKTRDDLIRPLFLAKAVGSRHAFFGAIPPDANSATAQILRNEALMGISGTHSLRHLLAQDSNCMQAYSGILEECSAVYLVLADIQFMADASNCCIQIENSEGCVLAHKCPRQSKQAACKHVGRLAAMATSGSAIASWQQLEEMRVPILLAKQSQDQKPEASVWFVSLMGQDVSLMGQDVSLASDQ